MFKETLHDLETANVPTLSFEVAQRYQIQCSQQEAVGQLVGLQIRKGNVGYDPEMENQISAVSEVAKRAIERLENTDTSKDLNVVGELWEDSRGLSNQIIGNLGIPKEGNWQTYSWLTKLLTDNFEPEEHFGKAAKLGLLDKETDPYVLRDALVRWKTDIQG